MVLPGYLIGISCLILITYRTMLAFFSESKSVTIYVNNFNEQFLDLIALVIIWAVVLVGLYFMIKFIKEKTTEKIKKKPIFNKRIAYNFNLNRNRQSFIGFVSKPSKPIEKKEKDKD